MSKPIKIAGVSFDHMHMGDLLRMAHEHPEVEIVGIADEDPQTMVAAAKRFQIPESAIFTDYHACMEATKPDLVIICAATGKHGDYVEQLAPYGAHLHVEKPMASSLADADRMIRAVEKYGQKMIVNWPLAWYPPHRTTYRLISEGHIGDVLEVHYYDGNRGPLRHIAGKEEVPAEEAEKLKAESWWYRKDSGGGSLNDYLGYGVTLGTWYHGGKAPIDVTCVELTPEGMEVDEHTITVARYDCGLSKFETRWGTFTDPWVLQPQPKCGFVVVGTEGTISSYDSENVIRVQTRANTETHEIPVDPMIPPFENVVQYFVHIIQTNGEVTGPLMPAMSRVGQQIADTAQISAAEKRTVPLIK